jgi:hypothetical protein
MKLILICSIAAILLSSCTRHDLITAPNQNSNGSNGNAGSGNNNYTLTLNNYVFTNITVTVSGQNTQIITPGSSKTFQITGDPENVSYTAYTSGLNSQGVQVGLKLTWSNNIDLTTSQSNSINLMASSNFFFLKMENSGPYDLSPVYVNFGTQSQTVDNIVIPNDQSTYSVGYYYAYSNTEIYAPWTGGNSSSAWYQGVQFTFPLTENQVITVYNTYGTSSYSSHHTSLKPIVECSKTSIKSNERLMIQNDYANVAK